LNQVQCAQGFTTTINAHFVTHQLSHVSEEYKRVRDAGLDKVIKSRNDR
jgi:enoyl-CoA hydratase